MTQSRLLREFKLNSCLSLTIPLVHWGQVMLLPMLPAWRSTRFLLLLLLFCLYLDTCNGKLNVQRLDGVLSMELAYCLMPHVCLTFLCKTELMKITNTNLNMFTHFSMSCRRPVDNLGLSQNYLERQEIIE